MKSINRLLASTAILVVLTCSILIFSIQHPTLHAQVNSQITGSGPPTGSCTSTQTYLDTSAHNLYNCSNGTWFLASSASLFAPSNPDCQIGPITAAAAATSAAYDNRATGCAIWTLEEFTNGSIAPSITIQLERADDTGAGAPMSFANWPGADIENTALGALANMQNIDFNAGQLTYYRFYPWVRVNLVSLGASGAVTYQALGYRPKFGFPTTSAGGALGNDVCANPGKRVTTAINVTSATTTAIAAVSGTTSVYPCQGVITIAPSGTSADTALLEFGTGASCAVVTKTLTGTFGAGDLTTTTSSLVVHVGEMAPSAFANGFCIVTAGTTVNVQGYFTYVQQ